MWSACTIRQISGGGQVPDLMFSNGFPWTRGLSVTTDYNNNNINTVLYLSRGSVLLQILVVGGLVHQLLQFLRLLQLYAEQPALLVAWLVDQRWFRFYLFVCFCHLEFVMRRWAWWVWYEMFLKPNYWSQKNRLLMVDPITANRREVSSFLRCIVVENAYCVNFSLKWNFSTLFGCRHLV